MINKLLLNSFSGLNLYLINIVVAFVLSPVMVHSLGNVDYGFWEIVMGVIGYMGLLDLGVGPALLRHVAVAHGSDNKQDLQNTISTALMFFICIATIAMFLFVGLSFYPEFLSAKSSTGSGSLQTVLLLFAVNSLLTFPMAVFLGILMGLQQHHLINTSRAIITIVRACVAYYLLIELPGKGLLILVSLEITANFIQFVIYSSALQRDNTVPRFSFSSISRAKMIDLFGYGAKSSILMAASRLQFASMPFIIGKALGLGFIVYFVLPNRLIEYAKGFAMAVGFPLTPYFANMIGKDDSDALKSGWLKTSFLLQIITVAMPLYLLFCGEKFLELWIGIEYASAGRWVMYALLLGLLAEAFSPNARQILLAKAQHGSVAMVCLVMSIFSIPLAFFGAKTFGVAGAALGSGLTTVTISLVTLVISCRVMKTPLVEYLKATLFPLVLPLLLLAISLWTGAYAIQPHNYLGLIVQIVVATFIYLTACWWISLTKFERIYLLDQLSSYRKKKSLGEV